mgnify:CR=1 FL=1
MKLEECLEGINEQLRSSKCDIWKNQINTNKPLNSFGLFEQFGYDLSSVIGINREIENKALIVFAGDHGVSDMQLSVYPKSQTKKVVELLLQGKTPLNKLINGTNTELFCVDMGIDGNVYSQNILNYKVANGTKNMFYENAIEKRNVIRAIEKGIEIATICAKRNMQIVALGEVGIGNTVSASVITAVLCNLTAEQVTGKGTGIVGDIVEKKKLVISTVIDKCTSSDPISLLSRAGGYEICGDVGFILGCAYYKIPVIIDGFITGAAALVAYFIHKSVRKYIFVSHQSSEPGHGYILGKLDRKPMLKLQMRYGLATGAALALDLYERAYMITNV